MQDYLPSQSLPERRHSSNKAVETGVGDSAWKYGPKAAAESQVRKSPAWISACAPWCFRQGNDCIRAVSQGLSSQLTSTLCRSVHFQTCLGGVLISNLHKFLGEFSSLIFKWAIFSKEGRKSPSISRSVCTGNVLLQNNNLDYHQVDSSLKVS